MSFFGHPLSLEWVMSDLYEAEINCGIESFWDGGFTVFIGDEMNGRVAEEVFYPSGRHECLSLSDAGNWLWLKSRGLYPTLSNTGGPTSKSIARIRSFEEQSA